MDPDKKGCHLLWDPLKSNRFAVGSNGVLRLYAWEAKMKQALELNWKGDLASIKSLAWSPNSTIPLLASANSAGVVSLISLSHRPLAAPAINSPYDLPPPPHTFTLTPPRQTRSTTALAFSPPAQDGSKRVFLAQGFTKIRADSSVMVWDVASMHLSADDDRQTETRQIEGRGKGGGFFVPLDPSTGTSGDGFGPGGGPAERRPTPSFSLIPTENVTALEWLDDSVLAVATQRQYIRLYDFRTPNPGQAVLQFGPLGGQGANSSSATPSTSGASQPASSLGSLGGRLHASGIQRDPFSANRLAAYDAGLPIAAIMGQDYKSSLRDGSRSADANDGPTSGGPVRIWDRRSPRAEIFRLEGPTVGAKTGGQLRSGAVGVKWDPERAGRLVVLERAGDLSVWDTVDPFEGVSDGRAEGSEGSSQLVVYGEPIRIPPGPSANQTSALTYSYVHETDPGASEEKLSCRLATFSTAQGGEVLWPHVIQRSPLAISPNSCVLYGPNLNLILPSRPESIDLSPYPTRRAPQHETTPKPSLAIDVRDPSTTAATASSAVAALLKTSRQSSPLRNEAKAGTVPSTSSKPVVKPQRGRSPAPAKAAEASDGEAEDDEEVSAIEEQLAALPSEERAARALSRDIAVVMRTRAGRGYGLHDIERDATVAAELGEQHLVDLWNWFGPYSERFSSSNPRSHGLDFSFVGVQNLWQGFNAASLPLSGSGLNSGSATPSQEDHFRGGFKGNFPSAARLNEPNRRHGRSSRESSPARTPRPSSPAGRLEPVPHSASKDFGRACAAFNDRRPGGRSTAMVSLSVGSKKMHERLTGLAILGWDLGEMEIEDEVRRLESIGKYERAAFCALFSGKIERSIQALDKSGDQHLRAIALTLLIHLQHADRDSYDRRPELQLNRIHEVGNPFLRAVWRYGLTNDLEELLTEEGLPLIARTALALKFAHDGRVAQLLRIQARDAVRDGDLMGLSITGLASPDAFEILRNFLFRTSDVQTVSILAAHTVPGRVWPEMAPSSGGLAYAAMALRWIETYEAYLHRSILFMERASFREAKGRLARERGTAIEFPVQVVVRCNFCNKNVSSEKGPTTPTGVAVKGLYSHICPTCQNALPRCSICLKSLGQALDKSRDAQIADQPAPTNTLDSLPLFCPLCRHGGHRLHLTTWFLGPSAASSSSAAAARNVPPNHPLHDPGSSRLAIRLQKEQVGADGEDESDEEDEGNETCPVAGCGCRCFG